MRRVLTALLGVLLFVTPAVAQTVFATTDTPVYLVPNPAPEQPPLRVRPAGSVFQVIAVHAGWIQVQFRDPQWGPRIGWVRADLLHVSRPPARSAARQQPATPPQPARPIPAPRATAPPPANPAPTASSPLPTASSAPAAAAGRELPATPPEPVKTRPTAGGKLRDVTLRGYVTSVTSPTMAQAAPAPPPAG